MVETYARNGEIYGEDVEIFKETILNLKKI